MRSAKHCIILVGGKGTRLGSLTAKRPKPMLDVGGRPFISYLIQHVSRHGFRRIILLAGHNADVFQSELKLLTESAVGEVDLTVLVEPTPLGTGGALKFAAPHLNGDFLLLNGDSFFDINLLALASTNLTQETVGVLALKRQADVARYGTVELRGDRVEEFVEKKRRSSEGLINGGTYWLRHTILEYIDDGFVSLETGVFPALASRGLLSGQVYDRFMLDIGLPNTLEQAQASIPAQIRRRALFLETEIVINQQMDLKDGREYKKCAPAAVEFIRTYNDAGYYVFLLDTEAMTDGASTESGVLDALHGHISEQLQLSGAHIDDYVCFSPESVCSRIEHLTGRWPLMLEESSYIGRDFTNINEIRQDGVIDCRTCDGILSLSVMTATDDLPDI